MLSETIKQAIITQLRMMLEPEEYKYIDSMLSEVYKTEYQGKILYTLKPDPNAGDIAVQFMHPNGAFYEITSWEYIQNIGEKII